MEDFKIDFTLKELKAMNKFHKTHKKCGDGTPTGKFTYMFTPVGIGICTVIKCNACDKWKDITDMDSW